MDRRSLFYWSREYTGSLKEGQNYRKLPNVIAINIVNFNYPPVRNSHTRFHLREDLDHDIVLTDALEIHFINMVQYRKQAGNKPLDDPLNRWMAWLDGKSPPDLIAEVLKMDSAINAANEKLDLITMDEEVLRYYHLRQMALSDYTSAIDYAREEGHEEGLAEGMEKGLEQGKIETARNLKSLGVSTDIIIKSTGLSPEEIAEL